MPECALTASRVCKRPETDAFREKGMFAKNTAVRLRDTHTIERLTELFGLDSDESEQDPT